MIQLINTLDKNTIMYIDKYFKTPSFNGPMVFITRVSEYGLIWMILICFLLASEKYRKLGCIVAFSFLLSRIELHIIKELVQRPRPFEELTYLNIYIPKPRSYSFPSGHAISTFATVGVLINMINNNFYKLMLIFMALLISISRLYFMVHYPSDLIIGIFLGILTSQITLRIFKIKKPYLSSS